MDDSRVAIGIDWSHTRGMTTYDGSEVRVESQAELLDRIREALPTPELVLEYGAPLVTIYVTFS